MCGSSAKEQSYDICYESKESLVDENAWSYGIPAIGFCFTWSEKVDCGRENHGIEFLAYELVYWESLIPKDVDRYGTNRGLLKGLWEH